MDTQAKKVDVDALIKYYQMDVDTPEGLRWLRQHPDYFERNKDVLEAEKEQKKLKNRLNAMKSTGPKTVVGKRRSSRNALKHGLTAKRVMLKGEASAKFKKFMTEMLMDLAPVGRIEKMLADRIITLTWRLGRAEWMESAVMDILNSKNQPGDQARKDTIPFDKLPPKVSGMIYMALREDCPDKFLAAVDMLPDIVCEKPEQPSIEKAIGTTVLDDFSSSGVFDKLLRYQRAMESSLYKAIAELEHRQQIRLRTAALTLQQKEG